MTVSVDRLKKFLINNGMSVDGSQDAEEKAVELLELIRAERSTGGDSRNVVDKFKSWDKGAIVDDLASTRSGMVSVFVNIASDFNKATGVRSANWFNIFKSVIAGRRQWDTRGAVGTHHYSEVERHADIIQVIRDLREEGYTIVAAEITADAVPITTYVWDVKTAVIYGEEGAGLTAEVLSLVDDVVFIPGRGSVRSLNVGTTSGIFMYDYSLKLGLI